MNSSQSSCCNELDVTGLATKLAALSHPARIAIVLELAGAGPCCCKQVVGKFGLAQSTISQHLKILVEAGLVRLRPSAQRSIYEVDANSLAEAKVAMSRLAEMCGAGTKANLLKSHA